MAGQKTKSYFVKINSPCGKCSLFVALPLSRRFPKMLPICRTSRISASRKCSLCVALHGFRLPEKCSLSVALRRFRLPENAPYMSHFMGFGFPKMLPKCRTSQVSASRKCSLSVALRGFRLPKNAPYMSHFMGFGFPKMLPICRTSRVSASEKCSLYVALCPFRPSEKGKGAARTPFLPLLGRDFGTWRRARRGVRARKMKPKCAFWWLREGWL